MVIADTHEKNVIFHIVCCTFTRPGRWQGPCDLCFPMSGVVDPVDRRFFWMIMFDKLSQQINNMDDWWWLDIMFIDMDIYGWLLINHPRSYGLYNLKKYQSLSCSVISSSGFLWKSQTSFRTKSYMTSTSTAKLQLVGKKQSLSRPNGYLSGFAGWTRLTSNNTDNGSSFSPGWILHIFPKRSEIQRVVLAIVTIEKHWRNATFLRVNYCQA